MKTSRSFACALAASSLWLAGCAAVGGPSADADADQAPAGDPSLQPLAFSTGLPCAGTYPELASRMRRVAFRDLQSHHFARAVDGGGGDVRYDSAGIDTDETFTLVDNGDGTVGILSATCQFLSAIGGGGGAVLADKTEMAGWERFAITRYGHYIVLRAQDGHYLDSGSPMRADDTSNHFVWLVEMDGDATIALASRTDARGMAYRPWGDTGDDSPTDITTDTATFDVDQTTLIDLGFSEVALRFRDAYLRAQTDTYVKASSGHIGPEETFIMGNSGTTVTFQTHGGHYLTHGTHTQEGLLDNHWIMTGELADPSDPHAQWRRVDISGAHQVALRSVATQHYVSAEPASSIRVIRTEPYLFRLVELGHDAGGHRIVQVLAGRDWFWLSSAAVILHKPLAPRLNSRAQLLTVIDGPDGEIALRTADGRYLTVISNGTIVARSTGVGNAQLFDVCSGRCRPSGGGIGKH
jgi:hypothetical protein